jgi:hypothetical protein
MSWNFEFSTHSLWLNFRPQVVLWRSRCRELEMWAQGLAEMSWNADLFCYSFWLNFKPQGVLWRSRCRELEIWPQRLSQMSYDFDFSYSLWLYFKAQVVLWRYRRRDLEMWAQAWLKWAQKLIYFFIHFHWTSKLKVFCEGLVAESLKSDLKGWLKWTEILNFLLILVVELQSSSCFMKVSFPRAWNMTPRLGWNELKFKVLFSIMWLNFKPQALLWRSHCRELEIWPQGLA